MILGSTDGFWGWVMGGVGGIITTLASVVARQAKKQESLYADTIDELKSDVEELKLKSDECLKDREDLRVEIAELKAIYKKQ